MNIHHLELFYYVAKHGGIMGAVRNIPYGIQQPAVSGQIAQLEEHLGVTLFQRRPFSLTPAGKKLFDFIQPFFAALNTMESELQGGEARHVRIGASGIVLRDHLPELVQNLRRKFPSLKVGLREGLQPELEAMLLQEEIDLAISLVEKKSAPGVRSLPLIELPLVLLVAKKSRLTDAEQLWKLDKITEPLICLPPTETICRNFQAGLTRIGVDWFPGIEASSLDLVETYVSGGLGIGVSIALPRLQLPTGIRALPLPGFDPIIVGALWRGKMTPLLESLLGELKSRAKLLGKAGL
ncbi:MAG TPA: LysR family transcriptional regulator [Verrucomicrobiae bacterium]|jgi:DNA-binding transcriptional LysR family regulator|nr:LysR family transcriptional regulator [Verrucomicrobiae bacterium]